MARPNVHEIAHINGQGFSGTGALSLKIASTFRVGISSSPDAGIPLVCGTKVSC